MTAELVFHLKAVTDIWTGGADRNRPILQPTGLLGSFRWWAEAIVRGMGARACDPTDGDEQSLNSRCTKEADACYICRLFGSSGLIPTGQATAVPHAARFLLRITTPDPRRTHQWVPRTDPLRAGNEFYWMFLVPKNRPLESGQRWLLARTMEIICKHGSIGGRTTRKPSHHNPGADHHKDFGILELVDPQELDQAVADPNREDFLRCVPNPPLQAISGLPDLRNFWFVSHTFQNAVNKHQTTGTFNHLIGLDGLGDPRVDPFRPMNFDDGRDALRAHLRGIPEPTPDRNKAWLRANAGTDQARSKRVFSFVAGSRTWGYVLDSKLLDGVPGLLRAAGCSGIPNRFTTVP